MKRPYAVRINFDFEQNGYTDDAMPTIPLPNKFTNQRFGVSNQICTEPVSFMTAKKQTCVSVSIIFEVIGWLLSILPKITILVSQKFKYSIEINPSCSP